MIKRVWKWVRHRFYQARPRLSSLIERHWRSACHRLSSVIKTRALYHGLLFFSAGLTLSLSPSGIKTSTCLGLSFTEFIEEEKQYRFLCVHACLPTGIRQIRNCGKWLKTSRNKLLFFFTGFLEEGTQHRFLGVFVWTGTRHIVRTVVVIND